MSERMVDLGAQLDESAEYDKIDPPCWSGNPAKRSTNS
ncbi:hypothetical protein MGAST_17080 [Mycobacterium gastri 'Wayne']|nr:hypothetical protein MGAST_17080 [Mycobacterium gastri 'Wayne']